MTEDTVIVEKSEICVGDLLFSHAKKVALEQTLRANGPMEVDAVRRLASATIIEVTDETVQFKHADRSRSCVLRDDFAQSTWTVVRL